VGVPESVALIANVYEPVAVGVPLTLPSLNACVALRAEHDRDAELELVVRSAIEGLPAALAAADVEPAASRRHPS
jgi:hypothetical protein